MWCSSWLGRVAHTEGEATTSGGSDERLNCKGSRSVAVVWTETTGDSFGRGRSGTKRATLVGAWEKEEENIKRGRKVEADVSWEGPTCATEVHSFLGLVGYYRHFVENFSQLALPLTVLTRKNAKFEWLDECEKSFQELKKRLVTTPILTLPVTGNEYVIYCDASSTLLSVSKGSKAVVTTESSGSLLAQFEVRSSLVAEIVRR
ncbi:DNA/RNA polymerases superfamily protein [Cucumis melo var. makuwa]|uniref:DNA/RNA polymerases superfamily protein n=1 Tax=Cucumis melo var. makuwa TaxID=1194695 RepID=A0A5D3DXY0_CUCMM|nr:DNA/RNA polymerases superfamily protein [Cucumis melo var. makuwa]